MSDSVPSHENALDVYGFQRLYAGACKIDNPEHRFLACYIILLMGRLGLRIAELQHLREEWIDWERGEIRIPERDPCACQRCWIQAYDEWGRDGLRELKNRDDYEWNGASTWKHCTSEQREEIVEKADSCTPGTLKKIVVEDQFGAKYDKSARTIPFGWSERLTCVLMTFFDRYDSLDYVQNWINELITKAAENAEGINEDEISAHNLRATGLTFLADCSVDPKMLRDLAGWEDIQTAVKYLRQSGRITTHKMYHIMGRGEDAPPIVPGEPEYKFPVVLNPQPFQGEPIDPIGPNGQTFDADVRSERALEQLSNKLKVRHYREVNIPENRAAFPTKPELDFSISDLSIPGHIDPDSDLYDAESGSVRTEATTLSQYSGQHTVANPRSDKTTRWRKESFQQSTDRYHDNSEDTAFGSTPGMGFFQSAVHCGQVARDRGAEEWKAFFATEGPSRPLRDKVVGSTAAIAILMILGITMASNGIYLNPITGEGSTPLIPMTSLLLGCAISTTNILWTDYCVRIADQVPYPRLAALVEQLGDMFLSVSESPIERS